MDNKWFLLGALLLFGTIVISAGGLGEILGGTTATTQKVDLQLDSKTKETLANLDSKTESVCTEWILNCLEYEKCLKFDEKTQTCITWDTKSKCLKDENTCNKWEEVTTPIGIEAPRWWKEREIGNQTCWAIIAEPYIHIYNQCLPNETDMNQWVNNKLNEVARDIEKDKEEANKTKLPLDTTVWEGNIK